jgi:hypothetical protein
VTCGFCDHTAGAARDIVRHIWSHHPDVASQSGIKSDKGDCPFPECGYRARKDNVIRHYKAKHRGIIKWHGDEVIVE